MDNQISRKTYSTQTAMLKYGPLILQQLPKVDRAENLREMYNEVQEMLQLLSKCSGAERVFMFDKITTGKERYELIYEYNAPGSNAAEYALQSVAATEIPNWIHIFAQGDSVVIRDIEMVQESMPEEYELLKRQGIRSEVVAPLYSRNEIRGFIGLDNPYEDVSELFIQQAAFVGSHLNAARENQQMIYKMEENLHQMEKEREMLLALCNDSTSVFKVDLVSNLAETVKLEHGTNGAEIISNQSGTTLCYSKAMREFYDTFVVKESALDYMDVFAPSALMKTLSTKDVFTYHFQMIPNKMNQQYFEVRAIRLQHTEESFLVLLDFRHIDEIIEETRRHQQELEHALEATQMSYATISAIGKIYYSVYRINLQTRYFEEISGNKEKLLGEDGEKNFDKAVERLEEYIVDEHVQYVDRFMDVTTLADRLKDDDSVALEYMVEDGNWHLARFIVQSRDENGIPVEVLLAIRVISEEKRREKYLIGVADDANQANEAKSEFLSRMSHDIRTPMNAIVGFANIARQYADDSDKVRQYLDKILLSSGNLQQLIDDVLDISRIESGEVSIGNQPMDILELCEDCSETVEGMASEKQLKYISKSHDISHRILLSDQLRLRQVYINLLSNAIKYTPAGGTVEFEVYEEESVIPDKVRLVAVVRDTGIGMTPEFMEKMYSRFAREIDTRVNKVRGSGLGLSIVKMIVDLMGGNIEVESQVQRGSTFRVLLDLPYAKEAQMEANENTHEAATLPDREITLLAAEDNDLNYEILREQLRMQGIRCVRAINGKECLEMFRDSVGHEYDAILMDMQMPVMNGLEAARAIRKLKHPEANRIPIIALTANAYQEDMEACMAAGMNEHLAKPIRIEEVVQVLAKYL